MAILGHQLGEVEGHTHACRFLQPILEAHLHRPANPHHLLGYRELGFEFFHKGSDHKENGMRSRLVKGH